MKYIAICAAFRILGLNPYHFNEVSRNNNNGHFQLWLKAVQAKYDGEGEPWKGPDFDRILWNYDVSCPYSTYLYALAQKRIQFPG